MRKLKKIIQIFVVVTTILTPLVVTAKEFILLADEWCPYNCTPKTFHEGFAVEVIREILKSKGHTLKYKIINWPRAIKEVLKGNAHGVIGASVGETPGLIFMERSIFKAKDIFIVPQNSPIRKFSEKEFTSKDYTVAAVHGYSYNKIIDRFIASKSKKVILARGDQPLSVLVNLLKKKRVDVVIENASVWNYYLKKENMEKNTFREVGNISAQDIYIALSPVKKNSKLLLKILDDGLNEFEKTDHYKKLKSKYGI